jgi:hypothetical protein
MTKSSARRTMKLRILCTSAPSLLLLLHAASAIKKHLHSIVQIQHLMT